MPCNQDDNFPGTTIFLQASEFKEETRLGAAVYMSDLELCSITVLSQHLIFNHPNSRAVFSLCCCFQSLTGGKGYLKRPRPMIL